MPPCFKTTLIALMTLLLISGSPVAAQFRSKDSGSQRILPLPEEQLSNVQTQMQLLQKLRSLVTGSQVALQTEATSGDDRVINDEQLEQLQHALKKLQDQLPPGIKLPNLDSIPRDQLNDAIASPAVQQQLKKMLEQFSRDGLLPRTGHKVEPETMPPIPRRGGRSLPRTDSSRQSPPDPVASPAPAEKSWQSLQDAMKKLSEIAQGGTQKSIDNPESDSSSTLIPSVSDFLKEQLRNGQSTPKDDQSENIEFPVAPPASNDEKHFGASDSGRPDHGSQRVPGNPSLDRDQPAVDIRRELESRGIRGTIEKLVEKAREESRSQQRPKPEQKSASGATDAGQAESLSSATGNEAVSNAPLVGTNDAGLPKALTELLSGMDSEMRDVIKDAKLREPETRRAPPVGPALQPEPGDSESRLKTWHDAAAQFFSDLSKAPEAPPSEQTQAVDDESVENPPAFSSWFVAGLGLLGLLAAMAICIRRPLLKIVSMTTGFAVSNGGPSSGEIRSRDDVISAFHELVLNPEQLVEAWWTHRAAARKLAADSPQQERAVRTLAEIYEQARYLPDDVELPAESIQSARAAFNGLRS